MAGYFSQGLALECDNLTLANSGVDGSGASKCSVTLYSEGDLDPANTGDPISYVENGLQFGGTTLRIGDVINVNYSTATNFPRDLSSIGNSHKSGVGFAGYIASISPTTRDGASAVRMELSDERWKWNRFTLPTLLVNQGQKLGATEAGTPPVSGSTADKEMTVHEILSFVEQWVRNFHADFSFDYAALPDKQIGETTIQGAAYSFLVALLREFYGTQYQFYSAGAGHLEVVKVETRVGHLSQFKVDRHNLIQNNMTLASNPNEDIDVLIGIGANKQYYVGDGEYDNELVPDWDWWNDGRLLVIDANNYSPAFYLDVDGRQQLVNPFDFGIDITDPENPTYLAPGAVKTPNVLVFRESFDIYPSYSEYMKRMQNPSATSSREITQFAVGTTYGLDALRRPNALTEAIHNGRFRRFRLKDYKWREYLFEVTPGVFEKRTYTDSQLYPTNGKKLPGDPANLNAKVLASAPDVHDPIAFDRYRVQDKEVYAGYKTIILDEFINNTAHEIRLMRAKPGVFLTGVDNPLDIADQFLPQVNENDPTEIKEGSSIGPVVVRYGLVSNLSRQAGSAVFAERIRAENFQIVSGNKVLFSEPQIVTSGTISSDNLKAAVDDSILDTNDAFNVFFDPKVYRNDGTWNGKYWYYFLRNGQNEARFPTVRKQMVYDRNLREVSRDGRTLNREAWIVEYSEFPIAIPRLEIFCFVQYVDYPERENIALLANFRESAYWNDIKTLMIYPSNIIDINQRKIGIEYRNDLVIQEGGIYTYSGDQELDAAKFEVISYYDDAGIDKAFEDFDSGDQHTAGFGQKKTVIAFQLKNDRIKFYRDAADKVQNLVPKGTATYYDRSDLRPEKNATNVLITSVSHSFSNGWQVTISYGGTAPTIRKLYEEDDRLNARVFDVMDNLNNKVNARLNVTPAQARRTT